MKKELLAAAIASTLFTGAQALADHHNSHKTDGSKAEKNQCKGEGDCKGKAMQDGEEHAEKENKCGGANGCDGE